MPHAPFCLRDKGHFSKRNIRSLFLVLILRTACHNAFTFRPYIWIRNPSCAFEDGMQTPLYNFQDARHGHGPDSGSCSRVAVAIAVAIGWEKALSCLFSSLSHLAPFNANCPSSVDGGSVATAAFSPTVLPPVSFSLWETPETALSLRRSALGSTVAVLETLCLRPFFVHFFLLLALDEQP